MMTFRHTSLDKPGADEHHATPQPGEAKLIVKHVHIEEECGTCGDIALIRVDIGVVCETCGTARGHK